jgi:hypothetical protein
MIKIAQPNPAQHAPIYKYVKYKSGTTIFVELASFSRENCHTTEKSEAIAQCKEMPVIPVNKVVDPKRMIGTNGGPRRRRGTRGYPG